MDQFDSILILADAVAIENGANMMSCDSRSLVSLLIMQDIQKKLYDERRKTDPNIKVPCDPISEILDSRTKSLLAVANCKGYIMSNQIISSVIAQVSEEKDINAVLREILTAGELMWVLFLLFSKRIITYNHNVSLFFHEQRAAKHT